MIPCLIVILLGPPGSGKGTQAQALSQQLHIPHISTGELFRANIKSQTPLGIKAKQFIIEGKLVPDSLVLNMLFDRLKEADCASGYILDGVPRTVQQAQVLDAFFKEQENCSPVIIQIDLADEAIVERISGRFTCQGCGRIYHKNASPPKREGQCDTCHSSLIQRDDDKQEVVKERLRTYHAQTKPVEEYYKKTSVIHHIDGSKAPDVVLQNIQQALK